MSFPLLPQSENEAASSMDQLRDDPCNQKTDPHQKKNGQNLDKNSGEIVAIVAQVFQVELVRPHPYRHFVLVDKSVKI
jgi:hypothetical protein